MFRSLEILFKLFITCRIFRSFRSRLVFRWFAPRRFSFLGNRIFLVGVRILLVSRISVLSFLLRFLLSFPGFFNAPSFCNLFAKYFYIFNRFLSFSNCTLDSLCTNLLSLGRDQTFDWISLFLKDSFGERCVGVG